MTGFSGLALAEEGEDPNQSRWAGTSRILGPAWAHLPTLTVTLLGVQIYWSVEMSYASPYLLSLGLSKSLMAMVFIAGPLSGLIMQPLIGVLADNSKSRFGRRRPYMLSGVVFCVFAMCLLGFTRPFASIFTTLGTSSNDVVTIWLAVLAIYFMDFSINAVQAVDRALVVDTLPASDQARANAWAAQMLGVGSVAGFFIGNINLPKLFPIFGNTQLEVLAVIASIFLICMHAITSIFVKEKVLISTNKPKKGFKSEVRDIIDNMRTLPRNIRQIVSKFRWICSCMIQFFAWLYWFPVLFYTTTYIGELHKRASPVPVGEAAERALDAEATRLGSRALFYSAILSLTANIILPYFVAEARGKRSDVASPIAKRGWFERFQVHLASLWAASHFIFAVCMFATLFTSSVFGATILMTLTGIPWAITQWAPFSLLSEAILTEPHPDEDGYSIHLSDSRTYRTSRDQTANENDETQHFLVGEDDVDGAESERSKSPSLDEEELSPRNIMGNPHAQRSLLDVHVANGVARDSEDSYVQKSPRPGLSSKAGIILGIHNIFIVIPQFLVTGLSSVIFAIFDPEKSVLHGSHPGSTKPGLNLTLSTPLSNVTESASLLLRTDGEINPLKDTPNSVAIIFRIGGLSASVAFFLCWRLARELRHR